MCKHTDDAQTRTQMIPSKLFHEMYRNLNGNIFKVKIKLYVMYKGAQRF